MSTQRRRVQALRARQTVAQHHTQENVATAQAPLFSPMAVAATSLLGCFGGFFLMAMNYFRAKRPTEAVLSLLWGIAGTMAWTAAAIFVPLTIVQFLTGFGVIAVLMLGVSATVQSNLPSGQQTREKQPALHSVGLVLAASFAAIAMAVAVVIGWGVLILILH